MTAPSRSRRVACNLLLALSASFGPWSLAHADVALPKPAADDIIRVELHDYQQLESFFVDLGYTVEAWDAGERVIPRLFLQTIPDAWREEIADSLTVTAKKRVFFRTLGPLTLLANDEIAFQQSVLKDAIAKDDSATIAELATQYRVDTGPDDPATITTLQKRVAPVPASLAMAQMAIESGWGTSRFAAQGNGLMAGTASLQMNSAPILVITRLPPLTRPLARFGPI